MFLNFAFDNNNKKGDGKMEYSKVFVCIMGIGTVFFGLICIILLCMAVSAVVRAFESKKPAVNEAPSQANSVSNEIPNRKQVLAAVCAVVAEELGEDVSAIKVTSFKKI